MLVIAFLGIPRLTPLRQPHEAVVALGDHVRLADALGAEGFGAL